MADRAQLEHLLRGIQCVQSGLVSIRVSSRLQEANTRPIYANYIETRAKVHEIAIEASLSAIVFSYIRYELMLGDGIPFGALFSGLQISQASYLWSMEYWGTFSSKNVSWKSKLRLLSVVTASIFLAAVSGPSSAILLVPKLDYWPAGSTNIWMNITSDSLWPIR